MVHDYVEVLRQVKAKSKLKNTSFKSQHWTLIMKDISQNSGPMGRMDKSQLQSKLSDLKNKFKVFNALKEASGFGWEESSGTVTAADSVWTSYLASHPKAKQFRHKGLEDYERLCELFGASIATRKFARSTGDSSDDSASEDDSVLGSGSSSDDGDEDEKEKEEEEEEEEDTCNDSSSGGNHSDEGTEILVVELEERKKEVVLRRQCGDRK